MLLLVVGLRLCSSAFVVMLSLGAKALLQTHSVECLFHMDTHLNKVRNVGFVEKKFQDEMVHQKTLTK